MSVFGLAEPTPVTGRGFPPWGGLVFALGLVFLNGFFVAAEFALVKVRPTQIEPHAQRGERSGRLAQHMISHLDAYLSATQLGITLSSLALGWVGEPAFAWVLEPLVMKIPNASPALVHSVALWTAFSTITILHIVLGELAPKSIAIRKPEPTALVIAVPLFVFYKISFPIIWLLNHTANALLKLIGVEPVSERELAHSEEELRLLVASDSGVTLSPQKRELIDNVFELSNRTARQIMVPRTDVVYLTLGKSLEDNLQVARTTGHTRFPLCESDLDHVLGFVHIKDLFRASKPVSSLMEVRREIAFVPETITLDRMLRRMRKERSHLAAVLDEFGGVSGIVTFENVIEEIVGQIQDEFDLESPDFVARGDNRYDVDGAMLILDLEHELNLEISERDEDTVAGIVLSELGRSPKVGDRVEVERMVFEVSEVAGNRIKRVQLTVQPSPSDSTSQTSPPQ